MAVNANEGVFVYGLLYEMEMGVSLFYLYLDGSVLPLLVTLSMLMDRAGCYNVREKKLIVHRLTLTVNSYGIATFPVVGEGLHF